MVELLMTLSDCLIEAKRIGTTKIKHRIHGIITLRDNRFYGIYSGKEAARAWEGINTITEIEWSVVAEPREIWVNEYKQGPPEIVHHSAESALSGSKMRGDFIKTSIFIEQFKN